MAWLYKAFLNFQKCTLYSPDSIDLSQAWYPCYGLLDNGDFLSHGWIEAGFPKNSLVAAIIIYFKSDGRFSTDSPHKTINVKLKDIHGNYHTTSKSPIAINCKTNPTLVHMTYDEKTTKFLTAAVRIEFEIGYLAIAGIALRSQDNPCGPSEFFNEKTSKCEAERIDLSACSTFKMPNSNVTCNNNGRHCNVTCNYGYQPKSTFPVYCKNGIWSKSKKCIPVDCGKLTVQNAKTSKFCFYSGGHRYLLMKFTSISMQKILIHCNEQCDFLSCSLCKFLCF